MYKKKVMKPQNKKDRLDEAEGKKKGGKLTPAQKKLPVKLKNAIKKKDMKKKDMKKK